MLTISMLLYLHSFLNSFPWVFYRKDYVVFLFRFFDIQSVTLTSFFRFNFIFLRIGIARSFIQKR